MLMTDSGRKAGLEFAAKLKAMLAEVPDGYCRRELTRSINAIQKHHGRSREQKEKAILAAIADGAATVREIGEETGIPAERVSIIMQSLEERGLIERRKFKAMPGAGRPSHIFIATEASLLVYV